MNLFHLSFWLFIFVLVIILGKIQPQEGFLESRMYSTPGYMVSGRYSTQWGKNLPWKLMGEKKSSTIVSNKIPQRYDPQGVEYADISKPEKLVNTSGRAHLARGHPYKQKQLVGWRWRHGYRPQFWRNFPLKPIWNPPRQPSATGQLYWTTTLPPLYPLCVEFARRKCAINHYPHDCFRRNYAKCLGGFAI